MSQKIRKERITKTEFYARGGFANSALFRQQSRGGAWRYYVSLDQTSQDDRKAETPKLVFAKPTGRWMNGRKL